MIYSTCFFFLLFFCLVKRTLKLIKALGRRSKLRKKSNYLKIRNYSGKNKMKSNIIGRKHSKTHLVLIFISSEKTPPTAKIDPNGFSGRTGFSIDTRSIPIFVYFIIIERSEFFKKQNTKLICIISKFFFVPLFHVIATPAVVLSLNLFLKIYLFVIGKTKKKKRSTRILKFSWRSGENNNNAQ